MRALNVFDFDINKNNYVLNSLDNSNTDSINSTVAKKAKQENKVVSPAQPNHTGADENFAKHESEPSSSVPSIISSKFDIQNNQHLYYILDCLEFDEVEITNTKLLELRFGFDGCFCASTRTYEYFCQALNRYI